MSEFKNSYNHDLYIQRKEYYPLCQEKENVAYKLSWWESDGGVLFKHLLTYYFENDRIDLSKAIEGEDPSVVVFCELFMGSFKYRITPC